MNALSRIFLDKKDRLFLKKFKNNFGFYPSSAYLYKLAFRHKSLNINPEYNNERLEFLGDSVLSSAFSYYLYQMFPKSNEGFLTQIRSKITNRNFLNKLAFSMRIEMFVEFDSSIQLENRPVNNLFGNALEAFFGAMYIDKGYNFTYRFIVGKLIKKHIDINSLKQEEDNYKGRLYELVQRDKKEIMFVMEETEIEDQKMYTALVIIDGMEMGRGTGYKKKAAEQQAAEEAYKKMQL